MRPRGNTFLFAVFAVIGAALLILIFAGGDGMIGPFSDDQFARTVYLGLWGSVIAAGIVASRQRFGSLLVQAMIWIVVGLVLVIGYSYRFELGQVANRVGATIVPGMPISTTGKNGEIAVNIGRSGTHFETSGTVNGTAQDFIVDTGASAVVLTTDNARKAGYDVRTLDYSIPVTTANGTAMAARIPGVEISIGGITRNDVTTLVAPGSQLATNLLGMSFLGTLTSFEVRRDRLILRD